MALTKTRRKKSRPKLIIDVFAGGGGASHGIEQATGRSPDVAINHDAASIAMHKANHPKTRHLLEDVWKRNPREVTRGRPVGLLWASPDCRHFSRAKGDRPVSKEIRSLAWVVVRWAIEAKPDVIILENVREFQDWGPLLPVWCCKSCDWKGTEGQATLVRTRRRCPRCESLKLKETEKYKPDPDKVGITFKQWVGRLRAQGYEVQWKVLNASDFGAPTHRRRLFLVARRDGKPIVWPEPTHGDPKKLDAMPLFGRLKPWRTAAECIDFSLPALSIFATPEEAAEWARARGLKKSPQRPLAEKTMRRIAMGLKRYVLENANPFIVRCDHGGTHFRGQAVDQPLSTVAGKHGFGIVDPFVINIERGGTEFRGQGVDTPLNTITAQPKGGKHAIVAPILTKYHGQKGDESRCLPLDQPTNTIDTQNRFGLVAPTLIQTGYGERDGQAPRALDIESPLGTVVSGGQKHALASAFISQYFGGRVGKPVTDPLPTVTAIDHNALVAAQLVKFRGDSDGGSLNDPLPTVTAGAGAKRPAGAAHAMGLAAAFIARFNHGEKQWNGVDEPLSTVTSQGNKFGLVYAFLIKYFGSGGQWGDLHNPAPTATARPRFGLVMVEVAPGKCEPAVALDVPGIGPCIIVDITLRMLVPRELARAQGFEEDYVLFGSTSSQVARIGNSVSPPMARAMVAANCGSEVLLGVA